MLTIDDVKRAAVRIQPVCHRTPLLIKSNISAASGFSKLFLKVESLQRTSSFKVRGAANAVLSSIEQAEDSQRATPDT